MDLEKVDGQLEHIGKCNVEINDEDKYSLKINIKLPLFVPAIDEDTGELWYVCTRKNINLRYMIKNDKYIVQSDDEELLEFLFGEEVYGGNR